MSIKPQPPDSQVASEPRGQPRARRGSRLAGRAVVNRTVGTNVDFASGLGQGPGGVARSHSGTKGVFLPPQQPPTSCLELSRGLGWLSAMVPWEGPLWAPLLPRSHLLPWSAARSPPRRLLPGWDFLGLCVPPAHLPNTCPRGPPEIESPGALSPAQTPALAP